jgi:predicted nucleic acid-binding protein
MSVEPGIVDTNVLVYALDADAPQHEAARALLEAAREASTTLFMTSQILCEFYSVVTNPRRVPSRARLPMQWPRFPACLGFCMCCRFLRARLT